MATGLTKGQDTTNRMRVYQGFRDQREALAEEGDARNNRKRQEGTLGEPLGAGPVCTDEATLGSDPRTRSCWGLQAPITTNPWETAKGPLGAQAPKLPCSTASGAQAA